MAQMGIGTSILGYANNELVKATNEASLKGINCTLNSYEEFELAERLLHFCPTFNKVKFARSGGEAMAIAIRIARAATGKDKVVFSGYHGWEDWYLAANINQENTDRLSEHLLPGLEPLGVPRGLSNTAIPFLYNDIEDFKRVMRYHDDIGIICIEGARYDLPNNEFLDEIKKVAEQKNILLISDEITSGWRMTDGGVYKLNSYDPDIVVFGKGMGGGYAISAIVGKKNCMEYANNTFISSTMWTERIGFVAALKTLEILEKNKLWEYFIKIGKKLTIGWKIKAKKYNLKLETTNFFPLATFKLCYDDLNPYILTLFTQEMLKRGYLASSSVYISMSHTETIIDRYIDVLDEVFPLLSQAIKENDFKKYLKTEVRNDSFKRLTE